MRINCPINKILFFTDRLSRMGYKFMDWVQLLYSNKTFRGGKLIGMFQNETTNLVGVWYKGAEIVESEYEVGDCRRMEEIIEKVSYVRKEVYFYDQKKQQSFTRHKKVRLIMNASESTEVTYPEGKMYVTEEDKNGDVGFIIEKDGIAWFDSIYSKDSIPLAKKFFIPYLRHINKGYYKNSKGESVTSPLEIIKGNLR